MTNKYKVGDKLVLEQEYKKRFVIVENILIKKQYAVKDIEDNIYNVKESSLRKVDSLGEAHSLMHLFENKKRIKEKSLSRSKRKTEKDFFKAGRVSRRPKGNCLICGKRIWIDSGTNEVEEHLCLKY